MTSNKLRLSIVAILMTLCLSVNARIYLVSVGIADYTGFPTRTTNLRLPTQDAKTITELYSKNAQASYSLLLDKNATKSRILSAIKRVFGQAKPDDVCVFFFSGHGYPGGFCAADNYISYDVIRKAIAQSKSQHKMMFVDACRSGGMRVDENTSRQAINSVKKGNVMLFLSSRNNENSIESPAMKNGYFTTFLSKGLRGNADANKDRIITAKELYNFVHEGVSKISHGAQHPVMWGNFSDNMIVFKW